MKNLQRNVARWMQVCFGPSTTATSKNERNYRFLEEALELVQANGCTLEDVVKQAQYTFARPLGNPNQEVGGVLITLAALCNTNEIDMEDEANTELDRVSTLKMVEKIRAKQASKPVPDGVLPGVAPSPSRVIYPLNEQLAYALQKSNDGEPMRFGGLL